MANDKSLKRIYDLRVLGGDNVINALKDINKALAENARLKALANKNQLSSTELAEIDKYKNKIKELTVEEVKLKAIQREALNEKRALAIASTENANAAKKEKDAQVALEGSYKATVAQMKILRPLIQNANAGSTINFGGKDLNFSQAIAEYKKLSAVEQDFRRQFQKDGTLVGEYTTGIVQAFKSSGLDQLIAGQITKTKTQIRSLDDEFDLLKKELQDLKTTGKGSFETIEKEMIDNRNEAIRLRGSLQSVEQQFNGFKGIGSQISGSIRESFKGIRTDILRAGLAYLSFQGALQAGRSIYNTTRDLDSLNQALKQVSGTEEELAINNQFLQETTEQLGLQYVATGVAFKNFYASSTLAGISTDETRKIFYSAATASTALKLSQESTNGVLLAFSQIASKGKVQAEELRGQIGERVPGAFSIAAKAIGVTQAELNKMLERGEVASNTFLPKFAAELEKTFGGNGTKKVIGLQASVSRLGNEFTALISNNQSGLAKFFTILIDGAGLLIKAIPILVVALVAYSAAMLRTWVVTSLANEASTLYYVRSLILRAVVIGNTIAQAAYNAVMIIFTGSAGRAAAATTLLGTAMRLLPLGLLITGIAILVASFKAFGTAVVYGSEGMRQLAFQSRIYAEVQQKSNEATAEQISKLNTLVAVVTSTKTSFDTKKTALEELIKTNSRFSAALKDNAIDLVELKKALADVRTEIILNANAQASAELSAKQYKNYLEVVQVRQQIENSTVTTGGKVDINSLSASQRSIALNVPDEASIRSINGDITIGGIRYDSKKYLAALARVEEKARSNYEAYQNTSAEYEQQLIEDRKRREEKNKTAAKGFEVDLLGMKAELDALNKQINEFQGTEAALNKLISLRDSLQKKYDAALGKNSGTTKTFSGSRLSGTQKDAFKDIEAARDEYLAKLQLDFTQQIISEEIFLNKTADANIDAANKKLAILKGANAEERKQIAELKLYKLKEQQDLNDKLFAILSKEAENRLKFQLKEAQGEFETKTAGFNVTEVERLKQEQLLFQKQLGFRQEYNNKMAGLEQLFTQNTVDSAEKRAEETTEIERKLFLNLLNLKIAYQKSDEQLAEDAANRQQNETKINTADRTINVLNNDKLSPEQQANEIRRIELEETKNLLAQEVAATKIALELKEEAYKKGLATETEVSEARKKYKLAELALLKNTNSEELSLLKQLTAAFKNALANITGFFKGVKTTQDQVKEAVDEAKSIVKDALNNAKDAYFDNQRQQVDDELEASKKRIDLEEEQVLNTAKTEEEKESIRRQYDDKRKEAEKQAGEEKRKIALKQASIDFALAVVKTLAAYPFPFSLIPVAGLAIAYGLQRSQIQKQKFEKGGVPTKTGGNITGPSHANGGVPFTHEAEGDELAIINKKSAKSNRVVTVTGTTRQIASAINELGGGVSFARGATLKKLEYGGLLGANLKPPQGYSFSGGNPELSNIANTIQAQQNMILAQSYSIAAMSEKLSTLKVQVVAKEVRQVDDKTKKAEAIGTL